MQIPPEGYCSVGFPFQEDDQGTAILYGHTLRPYPISRPPAASHPARFFILLAPHSGAAWRRSYLTFSASVSVDIHCESRGQASFVLYVGLTTRPRSAVRPRGNEPEGSPNMLLPSELPTHPHPPARPRVPVLPSASAATRPARPPSLKRPYRRHNLNIYIYICSFLRHPAARALPPTPRRRTPPSYTPHNQLPPRLIHGSVHPN